MSLFKDLIRSHTPKELLKKYELHIVPGSLYVDCSYFEDRKLEDEAPVYIFLRSHFREEEYDKDWCFEYHFYNLKYNRTEMFSAGYIKRYMVNLDKSL